MSLDTAKLEKVREMANGVMQARCPACAEGGHDRAGEHLRIYPDGRFGCCIHPKDGQHRKQIFALAGDRKPGTLTLRLNNAPATSAARSVKADLISFNSAPLRTELETGVPSVPALSSESNELVAPDFGTLGTAKVKSRAYEIEDVPTAMDIRPESLKDLETAVPSVPGSESLPPTTSGHRPFLNAGGDLVIPFASPARYHWWNGGQSVAATLSEIKEEARLRRSGVAGEGHGK